MKRNFKLIMLAVTLFMVLNIAACDVSHYEQGIDAEGGFGWMQAIVGFLADMVYQISDFFGGHYIVGLIIITLLVRVLGWPIYSKSSAMSANMQLAQPDLAKLQEKYQGKKDEASQKAYQQEMMSIYRKYNINPLGCLFPFLQMPIFIAMYQVVRRLPLTDRYSDLDYEFAFIDFQAASPVLDTGFNIGDHWINIVLALIVGATMYFYQQYAMKKPDYLQNKKYGKTQQQKQSEQTMKFMTYFMVIMLTSVAFTNLGIALYWIIGNMFQFLQTYVNRKQMYKKHFADQQS